MARRQSDPWYVPSSQRARGSGTPRNPSWLPRVGLMVGLLFLVTGLMNRLGDPRMISAAFRNLGAPLDEPKQSAQPSENKIRRDSKEVPGANLRIGASTATEGHSGELSDIAPPKRLMEQASMWLYAFRKANPDVHRDLAEHLLAKSPSRSKFLELTQLWAKGIDQEQLEGQDYLNALAPAQIEGEQRWRESWVRFQKLLKDPEQIHSQSMVELEGFERALDRALLDSIRDASPWRSNERTALLRELDLASLRTNSDSDKPPREFPLSLLASASDSFRGKWIRVQGTIVEGPTSTKIEDPYFGTFEYHTIWLRPNDESTQPICLYLTQLPSELNRQEENATITIEVEAVHLKRLAYRSKRGLDIAPLLVGGPIDRVNGVDREPRELDSNRDLLSSDSIPAWAPPFITLRSIQRLSAAIQPFASSLRNDASALQQLGIKLQGAGEPALNLDLVRILFQLHRWPETIDSAFVAQRPMAGLAVERIGGIATKVDRVAIDAETQEWFGATNIYRVSVELNSKGNMPNRMVAWTMEVPNSWLNEKQLSQPCETQGLILESSSGSSEGGTASILLADRIEWVGKSMSLAQSFRPEIPKLWQGLGEAGWDLSGIDMAKRYQKQPLHSRENRSLMKLIDVCSASADQPLTGGSANGQVELSAILREPDRYALHELRSRIRILRVSRIAVEEDRAKKSLGGNEYYEIDGFADLGKGGPIRFQSKPNDPNPLVFEQEFPVTLLCREIPSWLLDDTILGNRSNLTNPANNDSGFDVWYPRKVALCDGIFYRLWQYSSGRPGDLDQQQLQIAPLLIACRMTEADPEPEKAVRRQLDQVGIFLLATSIAAGVIIWRVTSRRSNRRSA